MQLDVGHSLMLFLLVLSVFFTMLCVCVWFPDTLGDARQTRHTHEAG